MKTNKKNNDDDFIELSKEFHRDCVKDEAKKCILFTKVFLESLCIWPGNNKKIFTFLAIIILINLFFLGLFNTSYVIVNITDLSKATSGSTTAIVTIETIIKVSVVLYYKQPLNKLLRHIWLDFWPSSLASKNQQKSIRYRSLYAITTGATFFIAGSMSAYLYVSTPIIKNIRELPFSHTYPFNFTITPRYELLYVWHFTQSGLNIPILVGVDNLIFAIAMIYSSQFIIMQNVIEKICYKNDEMDKIKDFIDHHTLVLSDCELFNDIFMVIFMLQFAVSTTAICMPCVALVANPEIFGTMLSFLFVHLLQFFYYCSIGNDLIYQSNKLADAAYFSEWHLRLNKDFTKSLVLLINRAQKPVVLNVGGLFVLSYKNFITTLQLSFSIYTLLNSFINKE